MQDLQKDKKQDHTAAHGITDILCFNLAVFGLSDEYTVRGQGLAAHIHGKTNTSTYTCTSITSCRGVQKTLRSCTFPSPDLISSSIIIGTCTRLTVLVDRACVTSSI